MKSQSGQIGREQEPSFSAPAQFGYKICEYVALIIDKDIINFLTIILSFYIRQQVADMLYIRK